MSAPANAEPVRAFVATDLNQRAGPGTRFPVLTTVPRGNQVTVFGCLSDHSWCDGAYQNTRGWFSARYLTIAYGNSRLTPASYVRYAYLPTVSFRINSYWDRYYRERPFYAQLSVYADGGSVKVSVGSFHRPLSPHGSWTEVRGRNVWVPRVEPGWRPYTNGRWVYTRRHGWTWVSHEPFGWATDHYGRWAYSARIGWFWVPGTRWAPAWVAWRRSDDYVAWAPLPPDPNDSFGVSFEISFGNIPNYYWRPVRSRDFNSQDISNVIIGDNNQIINIINQTEPAGTVQIENNVVVNNVINVEYVEQHTGEAVVARELALTSSEAGAVSDETVEMYHPPASELEPTEAPEEIVPEEKVAQESATAGQGGDEPTTEDLVSPAPGPDEAPPEDAQATEGPPIVGEGEEPQPGAAEGPAAVDQGPAPEGIEPCPEGTIRQQDNSCGAPAAEAPPAEEVTPETATEPAAPPPPQAEPGQPPVLPPPGDGAQPAEPAVPESQEPCPAGTVRQQDGSCGAPAAEAPPAEEVTPQTETAPAPPPQAAPEPQPEPQQQQEAPPAQQQEPPPPPEPQQAPPQAQPEPPQQPAVCPEGQVVDPQGHCVPQ